MLTIAHDLGLKVVIDPRVVEAVFDLARFWLDKGVDGFPIGAVNVFMEDPALRDNPERTPEMGLPDGISPDKLHEEHEGGFTNAVWRWRPRSGIPSRCSTSTAA